MASGRIKGITIEIDGDTTKLTTALKQVDKQIRGHTEQSPGCEQVAQNGSGECRSSGAEAEVSDRRD